jgi:hypothetical protein
VLGLVSAATLTGTGTLTGTPVLTAAATLSGTGSLAAVPVLASSALLTGTGTLSGTAAFASVAALSGTGTLTAAWVATFTRAATLSGTGTLAATPTVTGAGDTGHVAWEALAAPARWAALPVSSRWAALATARQWAVTVTSPRWAAGPQLARWRITMTAFDPIAALSLEEVNVTWTSDLDGTTVNPTTAPLTVQLAFPVSSGLPLRPAQPSAWFAASWLAGGTGKGYVAQCLVGPGGVVTLTAGQVYDVWSKILGTPEQPVKFAGQLAVY